jgi:hypothetical protein
MIRLTIATSLVRAELMPACPSSEGAIRLHCQQTQRARFFRATERQQEHYANELNYLFLHKPGATLTDVGDYLKQDLAELNQHGVPLAPVMLSPVKRLSEMRA